jgi:hypothetical protein
MLEEEKEDLLEVEKMMTPWSRSRMKGKEKEEAMRIYKPMRSQQPT